MRFILTLLVLFLLSGCTALVMGGGSASKNDRGSGVISSDSAITMMISSQFRADTTVNVFKIDVRTYKGAVTLTGTVGNHIARDKAGLIAKGTKGVAAVNNLIVVSN